MKKAIKRVLVLLLLVFVVIQFFQPEKNIAAGTAPQDISLHFGVPAPVMQVLQRSCYDCHSNNTQYPWYYNIQPVAWWLSDHIREGKDELNFSVFSGYSPKKAAHKLDEIITETGEGEMPLSSYTFLHGNARLSNQEVELISAWAGRLADSIRQANNLPVK